MQHHQAGRLPQAAQLYREILRQQPNQIDALQLLGIIAAGSSNIELAIECFRKAVEENPSIPSFHYNLGNALREQGQQAEAIFHYQQALILQPNYVEAHNNLGLALEKQGKFEEAIAHYQRAITLQPNRAEPYHNLGHALKNQGQLEAAVTAYKQAITLKPNCAEFHHSLASTLQEQHLLEEAIAHYRQAITLQPNCAEFHNNLGNALKKKNNLKEAIAYYQQALTLKPIPAQVPYLNSPKSIPLILETPPNTRLKVGIAWSGSLLYRRNRNRSCSLNDFLKLLDVPNIAFYSLQKEPQAKELSQLSSQVSIQDLSTQLSDFADTACALKQLDLVISVDTAVAHLVGALGKPSWVLLSFVPDWRWMLERDDSLWYPTMRLFRQSQLGDWAGVFERVKQALHNYMFTK